MKNSTFIVTVLALAAGSAVSLYAAAPATPAVGGDAPAATAAPATTPSTATAPATGRGRGRGAGGGGGAMGRGRGPDLGPLPEIHAAVPNTLPGLLGKPIKWVSTGPLLAPQNDATHFLFSVKDPTISLIDGKWEIYATANMIQGPQAAAASQPGNRPARGGNWSMIHAEFKDFKDAPTTKLHYMDEDKNFGGYKCAPEMFYFTPQKKWYLTFQTQPPQFCTSDTPMDPMSWTKPQSFFQTNLPMRLPIDFHFIGDGEYMYMFFTGDDGNFYRSRTTYGEFPKGFGTPVVAMRGTTQTVFEAGYTYKIKGTEKYLTCVEAQGAGRYYRAYVADKLDGEWYPVEGFDTVQRPFAGRANISFEEGVTPWSTQVSHGEMVRDANDERMILDPNNLMFLYQGISDADNRGDYGALAYKVGLLRAVKE